MNKEQIGENAGIVWRALHNNRCSWEELVTATGLNPLELAAAIGWLAREDKIYFETDQNNEEHLYLSVNFYY